MVRVVLVVLLSAATTGAALAQFMATDCGEVAEEECEVFLKTPGPERQKAIIQELTKQREELEELDKMRKAGVKSDGSADPKKNEPDLKKK